MVSSLSNSHSTLKRATVITLGKTLQFTPVLEPAMLSAATKKLLAVMPKALSTTKLENNMEQYAWDSVTATLEDSLSALAEQLEGKVSKKLWNDIYSTIALCTSNGFKAGYTVSYDRNAPEHKGILNKGYLELINLNDLQQDRLTELSFRVLNYKNNS
jgi:hypothetical protein